MRVEVNVLTGELTELDDAPICIDQPISTSERWERIKVLRDDLQDGGGCLVAGKWFHSDTKSKQQQIALTMLGANIPAGLQWKTMDGTFVLMTSTLAQQVFQAQILREQAIFAHAEALKADPQADINTGWPSRYGVIQ